MSATLVDEVFTPDVRRGIAAETTAGTGLPNDCYTSAAWLALENKQLFSRTWMLAGFCHDIPDAGDVKPVTVGGLQLILVRDDQGEVRVFHNVCRHRGAMLLDQPCRGRKLITCPYHAWSYAFDGTLKSRPHFFGGDKHDRQPGPDAPRLVAVRHTLWHDLIFVDLAGDAVDFEQHFAPLTNRTSQYDFTALRYAETLDFDIKGNWKLVYENYCDPYHVPTLHPRLGVHRPQHQPCDRHRRCLVLCHGTVPRARSGPRGRTALLPRVR